MLGKCVSGDVVVGVGAGRTECGFTMLDMVCGHWLMAITGNVATLLIF